MNYEDSAYYLNSRNKTGAGYGDLRTDPLVRFTPEYQAWAAENYRPDQAALAKFDPSNTEFIQSQTVSNSKPAVVDNTPYVSGSTNNYVLPASAQEVNAAKDGTTPSTSVAGPARGLQLKTIDQTAVDKEAQTQAAPTYSKLRRALQSVSQVAANEDNPAKKREMLRAAMEGTGTGFSDTSLAAHNAALQTVGKNTDIENQGLLASFQADVSREMQRTGIASAEKMQGLSLAESRSAQQRGLEAQYALQANQLKAASDAQKLGIASSEQIAMLNRQAEQDMQKTGIDAQTTLQSNQLRAAQEAQKLGIASTEQLSALNRAAEVESQNRSIAANKESQALTLAQARESQLTGIGAQKEMQLTGLSSAEKQAQLNRDYESRVREQEKTNQLGLAGFNAEIARANADYSKPFTPYKNPQGVMITQDQNKDAQWQSAYQQALKNYYASVGRS